MIALRLVRLIESHSDELAHGLMAKFHASDRAGDLRRVPEDELKHRSHEIYRNLSDWLLNKTERDIEHRYRELGVRRAAQGVRYSHLFWAILLTKENLWDFLQREGVGEHALDLLGEVELLRMLDQFFDRALYFALLGYEEGARKAAYA